MSPEAHKLIVDFQQESILFESDDTREERLSAADDALDAYITALEANDRRYRFLRANNLPEWWHVFKLNDELDAAIDAALAQPTPDPE